MTITERTYQELGAARVSELEALARRDGVLTPRAVVEYATDPTTALHGVFQWDDTEAAKRYREWQARQYIRAVATVVPVEGNEPRTVRAFVSLSRDRSEGGYRMTRAVLSDPILREEMVAEALKEFASFRDKYQHIQELANFFSAADKEARRLR